MIVIGAALTAFALAEARRQPVVRRATLVLPGQECPPVRVALLADIHLGSRAMDVPVRLGAPPDLWLLTLGPAPVSPPRP